MINLKEMGYLRVATVVPEVFIGNPTKNAREHIKFIQEASEESVDVLLFPELSTTGYTCMDIFHQNLLTEKSGDALKEIKSAMPDNMMVVVGAPLRVNGALYITAVVFFGKKVIAVIPKSFLPNYQEFQDNRFFKPFNSTETLEISIINDKALFGTDIYFAHPSGANIAIEICEDMFVVNSPGNRHTLNGANVILNLSASDELVGKADYRRQLVTTQSEKMIGAYIYTSAGMSESTTDLVFGGHMIIAENGRIEKESRFIEDTMMVHDVDIQSLTTRRIRTTSMENHFNGNYIRLDTPANIVGSLNRDINPYPFVPRGGVRSGKETLSDILTIQSIGLATRLKKTGIPRTIIGVSGGLDSTLALLVNYESFKRLNRITADIIGVTMPGYGTTKRTKGNSIKLMELLGITSKEISITEVCDQHFKDLEHDPLVHDVTYENVQARERTSILMNLSNKYSGLVVGTGDLSELALGWCTYNGDHMSMYGVNASIPKTLVKYLIEYYAMYHADSELKSVLMDILDTPISPELLPPTATGEIAQKTEDTLGKYDIHDFIIFNTLRNGTTPKKMFMLLRIAFSSEGDEKLLGQLELFYRRFFSQQFKRSALPDGVKVGTVSFSPRSDWRMPSDMESTLWMDEIEEIRKGLA